MKSKAKRKLCWNCEGNVSLENENCPYCGVYLEGLVHVEGEESPFTPPYSHNPYQDEESSMEGAVDQDEKDDEKSLESNLKVSFKSDSKKLLIAMTTLLSGSVFFLFGLVLFLFSNQGVLALAWSTKYWYGYFLPGLLLIFVGWSAAKKLDEKPE